MHYSSSVQLWHKVGALDLDSGRLGYFTFSVDDRRAMVAANCPLPPWTQPLPVGIEVCRRAHDGNRMGRYKVRMTRIDLDPITLAMGETAKKMIAHDGHTPNSTPGIWSHLIASATLEATIEKAALAMVGSYAAGDLKKIVGAEVNVTPVLQRLVEEKRLVAVGKKKGTRYEIAIPVPTARIDWTG
jgi:hypothetical protein